jgi:trans-2,3-dihydro-3-hydroxyanthranilate isomerase
MLPRLTRRSLVGISLASVLEIRRPAMAAERRKCSFHFVDVFAVEPLTGNSLAVVEGGGELPIDDLRHIAREFNQSETTFILSPTRHEADFRLRSFTAAGVEVFGAGHNALGAWWWLAQAGKLRLSGRATAFHQEIGGRVLPVTVLQEGGKPTSVVMEQEAPRFDRRVEDPTALAQALGLTAQDLAFDRIPCQVVFTGTAHLLVPIRGRQAVDRIQPDSPALHAILKSVGAEGCYVFSLDPQQPQASAYARFFNPTVGIWEDPATGTAAGPLGAQLVAHGLAKPVQSIVIEQGTAMGRTSLIEVQVQGTTVKVLGRGVVVADGQLSI